MGIFNLFIVFAILHFRVFFSKSFKNLGISHFLVAESATIEMAFLDVCLEVREFMSLRKKSRLRPAFGTGTADYNQTPQKCSLGYPDPNFLAKILYLIFKVENSVFRPKTHMSSHSKHVQPNFIKFGNNVLVGTLCTYADKFFSYFNF